MYTVLGIVISPVIQAYGPPAWDIVLHGLIWLQAWFKVGFRLWLHPTQYQHDREIIFNDTTLDNRLKRTIATFELYIPFLKIAPILFLIFFAILVLHSSFDIKQFLPSVLSQGSQHLDSVPTPSGPPQPPTSGTQRTPVPEEGVEHIPHSPPPSQKDQKEKVSSHRSPPSQEDRKDTVQPHDQPAPLEVQEDSPIPIESEPFPFPSWSAGVLDSEANRFPEFTLVDHNPIHLHFEMSDRDTPKNLVSSTISSNDSSFYWLTPETESSRFFTFQVSDGIDQDGDELTFNIIPRDGRTIHELGDNSITYTYGNLNRLIAIEANGKFETFTYDGSTQPTAVSEPKVNASKPSGSNIYAIDDSGNLIQYTYDASGNLIQYAYVDSGYPIQITKTGDSINDVIIFGNTAENDSSFSFGLDTTNTSGTNLAGSIRTTDISLDLGSLTLGSFSQINKLDGGSTGNTITSGGIPGGNVNLELQDTSGSEDIDVRGSTTGLTTGLRTLTQANDNSVAVQGDLSVLPLITAPQNYDLAFSGSINIISNDEAFLNTGSLTRGEDAGNDSTFTNGLNTTSLGIIGIGVDSNNGTLVIPLPTGEILNAGIIYQRGSNGTSILNGLPTTIFKSSPGLNGRTAQSEQVEIAPGIVSIPAMNNGILGANTTVQTGHFGIGIAQGVGSTPARIESFQYPVLDGNGQRDISYGEEVLDHVQLHDDVVWGQRQSGSGSGNMLPDGSSVESTLNPIFYSKDGGSSPSGYIKTETIIREDGSVSFQNTVPGAGKNDQHNLRMEDMGYSNHSFIHTSIIQVTIVLLIISILILLKSALGSIPNRWIHFNFIRFNRESFAI